MSNSLLGTKEKSNGMMFSDFLEKTPPTERAFINEIIKTDHDTYNRHLDRPQIQLHCTSKVCNGERFFVSNRPVRISSDNRYYYLEYFCANCRSSYKVFSLMVEVVDNQPSAFCSKLGEFPLYGPPTPSRLIKLIGPDRETFLKGRRCENQGLGIGAFIYYRRVVENQKDRILDEIIKVSEKMPNSIAVVETLNQAKSETQFSKSLKNVKVPDTLLVNGHNPLTLLHSALSQGLHTQSDEECLEIASSVRIMLIELSDRIDQALKDEEGLKRAITKLLERKS